MSLWNTQRALAGIVTDPPGGQFFILWHEEREDTSYLHCIVIFSRRRDSKAPWLDKYGPPMRTNYRVTIENLSTRVSWQVSSTLSDVTREGVATVQRIMY